ILKRDCPLMKAGNERFYRAFGRGEAYENEGSAAFAEEDGIAQVEVGDDAGDARLVSQAGRDGCERLLSLVGVGRRQALNDEHDAVNKGGMKTGAQLLPDGFRLAAFDAGGRLQMAFGVK